MGDIIVRAPRAMVSFSAGVRPSKTAQANGRDNPAFLKEGGLFINFADDVLCVGTGRGGWIEYALSRRAVVNENA